MNKALLLLVALTLCCHISSLQAASRSGCRCIKTVLHRIDPKAVSKVEVTPPSGRCRRTERIIYRNNGSKICISPDAKWFSGFLRTLEQNNKTFESTTFPPVSSGAY